MKVEVALTELKKAQLIVAFPHESYVRPGVGDELIARLALRLPPRGIMLIAEGSPARAYAPFQTDEFLRLLSTVELTRFEIDLEAQPHDDDDELPF